MKLERTAWGLVVGVTASACSPNAATRQPTPPPSPQQQQPASNAAEKPDYERRDQPVSSEDLRILERAGQILADESKWNRKDNRECPTGATTWSLYCALHDASVEVLGRYEHRRIALQEVRFAIEEVTKGRKFQHRLMDFNNLPTTTLDDVRAVLTIASRRVAERLGSNRSP